MDIWLELKCSTIFPLLCHWWKYQKNPNTSYICVFGPSIAYSAVGAALTFTESARRTPAKRGGRANMLHATLTLCLLKEKRKNNSSSSTSTLWRHSVLEREDDSFESPHQTFTLCPSVKCQTDFQSSQRCREKRNTGGSFGKVLWHNSQYNCLKNCEKEEVHRANLATCSIVEKKTNGEPVDIF